MAPIASPPGLDLGCWPAPPPRVVHEAGRTVVWLGGEQDLFTAPSLQEVLAAVTSARDVDVVVDLSAVTFIDASTLGVLVRERRRLRERRRRLTVRSPSRPARRMLDVCRLWDLAGPPPATVEQAVVQPAAEAGGPADPDA